MRNLRLRYEAQRNFRETFLRYEAARLRSTRELVSGARPVGPRRTGSVREMLRQTNAGVAQAPTGARPAGPTVSRGAVKHVERDALHALECTPKLAATVLARSRAHQCATAGARGRLTGSPLEMFLAARLPRHSVGPSVRLAIPPQLVQRRRGIFHAEF